MAKDPTWAGVGKGMLVLSALWFAWASFAWLTNTLNPEEGATRLGVFVTMAALLVASLAVPKAFGDDGVIFGVSYLIVRGMHMYALAARSDASLVGVVRHLAGPMLAGATVILAAGFVDGAARYVLWTVALAIEVAGPYIRGVGGWRLHPGHFAERHGLIIIIAIGESIVAVGVGFSGQDLDGAAIVAAVLGVAIAAAQWWAYFDVVALVAERRLTAHQGEARSRMARDSYTFLHLPMMAGIILFALGMKKVLEHTDEPLKLIPAVALCGGLSLYLLAHIAFRLRNVGSVNRQRLVTAVVLAALIPLAVRVDALPALVITALAICGLIAYEAIRFARSATASATPGRRSSRDGGPAGAAQALRASSSSRLPHAVLRRRWRWTSAKPAARRRSGTRPAAWSRVPSKPSMSCRTKNDARSSGVAGRPQSAMCSRPPGRSTRATSASARCLAPEPRWCSTSDITAASALAGGSPRSSARPRRQATGSAPSFARASARISASPSIAVTATSGRAAAREIASVPVPAPTSTTWPAAGTGPSTRSRSSGLQRFSRIVTAIVASYQPVGPTRPAART